MRAMGARLSDVVSSRPSSASGSFAPVRRGLFFAPADELALARSEASALGYLVVELPPLRASARGRLNEIVDAAVEDALLALGAPAAGAAASHEEDSAMSLHLYRARQVGKAGITLFVGALRAMADARGALDARDGEALALLARATVRRPFTVLLDESNVALGAYAHPIPLPALLGHVDLSKETLPSPAVDACEDEEAELAHASSPASEDDVHAAEGDDVAEATAGLRHHDAPAARDLPDDDAWRAWAMALGALRGPMSLSAFERTFAESYMPLASAIARGLSDPRATAVASDFRRHFARSYTEAFSTFPLTGKRPKMVLDAPDFASRLARTHDARSALLMVDAMRWDLGLMVRRELGRRIPPRGALIDATCLFAALPTTTRRQLEGVARGIDVYRGPYAMDSDEPPSLSGRKSGGVRIVRTGARDLRCLELVEDRLRTAGSHVMEELPAIACDVADAIAHFAASITTRTVLYVFGDHGFTVDAMGTAHHGGASPEEVLVPAFAILLGEMH